MIHRAQDSPATFDSQPGVRLERDARARHRAPRYSPKACYDVRPCESEFGFQVWAAISYLVRGRIPIASERIARIASDEVGNEHAAEACMTDHPAEQEARAIAGEGNASTISAEAAGCEPDESDRGRSCAGARNDPRTASHQRFASHASEDLRAYRGERELIRAGAGVVSDARCGGLSFRGSH